MFTLVTDRSRYFRFRRGQSAADVRREFKIPVNCAVFAGLIIEVPDIKLCEYSAKVGDTYSSIAEKFGVEEELLKKLNGFKPVYPTRKLFVPCK